MGSVALQGGNVQYAALPWRRSADGTLEILLITTLNTRRWIVPKGWPVKNLSPRDCAAREALEEAGLLGMIAQEPVGAFHYPKQHKNGAVVQLRVEVFGMQVLHQRRSWAEKRARETCWCSVEEALVRVSEPGLRRLIEKFAKPERPSARRPARHSVRTLARR